MKKIIIASNNKNKIREIQQIFSKYPVKFFSMKEVGIDIDIVEDGNTFMENAYKKAKQIHDITGGIVIADDSGLMVDALNGAPGIYSARFCGEHGNDKKNNEKLLKLLEDKDEEDRKAKFVCAIVLILDDNKVIKVIGEVYGTIAHSEMGDNNFGYDPLFYVPEYNKTFAQMPANLKNSISHRAKALEALKEKIDSFMKED
ncbi:XTP/dITP diphosphatase [Clostridium tyrobutyricum]|uniref:XTP/dITP diphosphatase n=1 Tax=Clostridium tyrobutyricum TaxID=1519 RepID=UPI0002FC9E70|nr:XTP/dITP diphosphatase [Clostridium tyrobutyricum]MBR9648188.1 XTP/dITP diphosphatase [Clostridium tyrobutyricum]MBV4430257.1 XTP/dITP diphosphatase [Clostridium tyrobutyricum]MBV4437978.1 XTP/dITP diphosphatase [Clostridium tyrobutyricum]MBV4439332.1 XTP/dITP diphosphatase [Clostridium tyrobutyricum]MEA5009068.1 XTP/dITP diphosphatase [Clostridium tyrobutyricum]